MANVEGLEMMTPICLHYIAVYVEHMNGIWTKLVKYRDSNILAECDHGTFGIHCAETCGECVGEEPCDPVNGTCLKGCGPGYKGKICIESNIITFYLIIKRTFDRIVWTVLNQSLRNTSFGVLEIDSSNVLLCFFL